MCPGNRIYLYFSLTLVGVQGQPPTTRPHRTIECHFIPQLFDYQFYFCCGWHFNKSRFCRNPTLTLWSVSRYPIHLLNWNLLEIQGSWSELNRSTHPPDDNEYINVSRFSVRPSVSLYCTDYSWKVKSLLWSLAVLSNWEVSELCVVLQC